MNNRKKYLIIFSFLVLIVSVSGGADSHKYNNTDINPAKLDGGFWEKEDCREISDAAGFFIYMSGVLLEKAADEKEEVEDDYDEKESEDEIYESILFFTNLAATYADVYNTFCKK